MSAYERGARRTAAQSVLPAPPADGRQPLPEMNATTNSCLWSMPQLRCQRLVAGDNNSRLVCAASDGQEGASDMYAALVSLSALIVPAAVLLNLAVVVTVYMNRRLHTVINVLVTVLCMNNVMWTGIPIILVSFPNLRQPWTCPTFWFFFVVTRSVMFTSIVMITLLRYFIVVKNHSFPPNKCNIASFVTATLAVGVTKWMVQSLFNELKCQKEVAWTPDNFAIIDKLDTTSNVAPVSILLVLLEYGSGITILSFCYVKILRKNVQSRERLQQFSNGQPTGQEPKDRSTTEGVAEHRADHTQPVQKSSDSVSQPSTSGRHQELVAPGRQSAAPSRPAAQSDRAVSSATLPEIEPETPAFPEVAGRVRFQLSNTQHRPYHSGTTDRPPDEPPAPPPARPADADPTAESRPLPCPASAQRVRSASPASRCGRPACLTLQPARLLHAVTGGPAAGAAPPQVPVGIMPRPRAGRRRVDIVAGASLAGCLLLFLAALVPILAIVRLLPGTECVILPRRRLLVLTATVAGSGSAAVFSAALLVVFSRDFRQAFSRTCRAAAGAVGITSEYGANHSGHGPAARNGT